ncbi:unnamed protein product [Owenia fusiformis]|uniref:G-protein coupled receptors family 1 profile domain-containing protein n=1 Tax=Owenia fusiformis TaxID=6347 RepID=A0A8S4PTY3_OWEFU|nr:unnamed protein product [Owenia fusiformis]
MNMYNVLMMNETIFFTPPAPYQKAIILLISSAIAISNTLIIYVVIRTRPLWTSAGVFMLGQALTDSSVGFMYLGFYESIHRGSLNGTICQTMAYLLSATVLCRLLFLTAMSIDKLFTIKYPFQYPPKATTKRVILATVILCLLAYAVCIPIAVSEYEYRTGAFLCEVKWRSTSLYPYILQSIIYIFITTMTGAHVNIFVIARRHQKNINKIGIKKQKDTKESKGNKPWVRNSFKSELKAIKMIILLVGVLYVCWLMYIGGIVIYQSTTGNIHYPLLHFAAIWLGLFYMCIIILLYSSTNKLFRLGFMKYVLCRQSTNDPDLVMSMTM